MTQASIIVGKKETAAEELREVMDEVHRTRCPVFKVVFNIRIHPAK